MDRAKIELKVGIFILVAIVILAVFILRIGNLKSYGGGYKLRFVFNTVSGVKPGSPIRLSGVDVGEVKYVRIIEDKDNKDAQVVVTGWINKAISVPRNSQAFVNTLGLLGEKYIEIVPPSEYRAFLAPGEILVGTDPVMMQDWIDEGEKIVKDLQEILAKLKTGQGTAGKLLTDDKLYQELEALISDIRQAKEGTIGRLLYDDKLYQELEGLISDLRRHPWKLFWKTKEKKR